MARDKTIVEHREEVLLHLKYIKENVDNANIKLDKLNGRVIENEKNISFIKGFGSMVTAIFGIMMYLIKGE